jgi:hypothetical protein
MWTPIFQIFIKKILLYIYLPLLPDHTIDMKYHGAKFIHGVSQVTFLMKCEETSVNYVFQLYNWNRL